MSVKINGTIVISDGFNIQNIGSATATTFYGDGSNLTGVGGGGQHVATASGSISNGDPVVVNSNGSVSSVSSSGTSQEIGPEYFLTSSSTSTVRYQSIAIDGNGNCLAVWSDAARGNALYCKAGDIDGSTITWGNEIQIDSASSDYPDVTYHYGQNVFVIAYRFRGNTGSSGPDARYGKCRAGQITGSGSSISVSFGTPVFFSSHRLVHDQLSIDSINNTRFVIGYADEDQYKYATMVVGILTGTTIAMYVANYIHYNQSYGVSLAHNFSTNRTHIFYSDGTNCCHNICSYNNSYDAVALYTSTPVWGIVHEYDHSPVSRAVYCTQSNNKQIVLVYFPQNSTSYASAKTFYDHYSNPSFGGNHQVSSTVAFYKSDHFIDIGYDRVGDKVIFVGGSPTGSYYNVGTLSGSSITWGTAQQLNSSSTSSGASIAANPNNTQTITSSLRASVAIYNINQTSPTRYPYYGRTIHTDTTLDSNMTSENFIGFSDGSYSNGQQATIQVVGSVSSAQSGLTAGVKYYVHGDGALKNFPSPQNSLAGTAVSANKIIIKQ